MVADEHAQNYFFQALGIALLISIISGILSCFLFNFSWITAPLFSLSFGGFLGILSNMFKYASRYSKELQGEYVVFLGISIILFFLISNFLITLLLYYKKFRKQENQDIINKFGFVIFNFFIVTTIYAFLFFLLFIAFGEEIKIFKNVWAIIGLLFFSGLVASSSIFIASALCIFDVITKKTNRFQISKFFGFYFIYNCILSHLENVFLERFAKKINFKRCCFYLRKQQLNSLNIS
ncbi:hypothetical protein PA0223 [Candidatus Phytoplasma australiense]|uniref:Uncharacterized protein n=2 Tax=Phytoplasma australiense TaxID=59748 RepID=B1V9C6_PHYAS|nr:hypothetical protein [Candidatus Phytoplasma australiense]AGL90674.1 Hypothetical Protein SLY_0759 [Strawberry lethal yellows phytoplasma (CPA) str. NZSb11]CAM11558.1 hypothetical protein PA0223 [Candidatus Phytoplasma australiense]